MASIEYYATGRRKTSTARVFLRPGKGDITVNRREFARYFTTDALRTQGADEMRAHFPETQVELLHGLMLSLPGGAVLYYGDEVEMGDDYRLGEVPAPVTDVTIGVDPNEGWTVSEAIRAVQAARFLSGTKRTSSSGIEFTIGTAFDDVQQISDSALTSAEVLM